MAILTPKLASKHRADTISTFVLTVGLVDTVMGGVSGHLSLLILGLGCISGAIALRWANPKRRSRPQPAPPTPRALLTSASRPPLRSPSPPPLSTKPSP